MQGGVQIISKEVMKPSPHTFKTLKLSYIDISLPSIYIPFIFFYKADEPTGLNTSNHIQIPQILKHSLLATLPSFYPLAGELKHDIYVDYTDGASGFEFVEAKVHAQLKTALQGSTVKDMKLLLPSYCTTFDHAGWPLLVVQIDRVLIFSVATRLTRWASPIPELLGLGLNFYNPKERTTRFARTRLTRNPNRDDPKPDGPTRLTSLLKIAWVTLSQPSSRPRHNSPTRQIDYI
ncbi:(13S,14R)-1,13-dihydroxy-N-methylcanadine 13-O-acetyltransferase AT1-like isoform X1 [Salvia splendens]|uniref:(13S,14R)-1,13-dihydroxy-N-methylcanadine 13-O-acetyltransferase AT1-like isoform X1 n=1 Tax=Salvia splendens TaxID=180675 RepID=UPI001C25F2F7|nr:(13S,14R)-1,13-dihydroxy-N-methylcanadine 13-O-acetyltransferase AT1-like isoform X1 [Salvia splendens]